MTTNLSDLLQRKMEAENLSLRAAGERAGVAHTTIDRVLKEKSVELETLEKVCEWLGVPIASVLDIREDNEEVLDQIAAVLALSPQLAGVFNELAEKVLSGEIEASILAEVAAFTSYRLNQPLYGDLNEQSSKGVHLENRADSLQN